MKLNLTASSKLIGTSVLFLEMIETGKAVEKEFLCGKALLPRSCTILKARALNQFV